MILKPQLGNSTFASVTATVAVLASALLDGSPYLLASSTNCWVRQGTAKLVTCTTQANMLDTDTLTITYTTAGGVTSTKVYEFDKAGNGVTAGRVQVNISADTTAANVAARLKTAIEANQTDLRVVDPANGTLIIDIADSTSLTITEGVNNAAFTVAAGTMQATAAAGSMFVPAGVQVLLDGSQGAQVGILRDTADGKASCTFVRRF